MVDLTISLVSTLRHRVRLIDTHYIHTEVSYLTQVVELQKAFERQDSSAILMMMVC